MVKKNVTHNIQGRNEKHSKSRGKKHKETIKFKSDYEIFETVLKDVPFQREKLTKMDRIIDNRNESFARIRVSAFDLCKEFKSRTSDLNHWIQLGPTCIPDVDTTSNLYYSAGFIPLKDVKKANATGRVTSIVVDPSNPDSKTIYLGTALGGIWKTIDGGRNWFATSDKAESLSIGTIAISPTDPNILYAGTGESNFSSDSYYGVGLLKTIDGGKIWSSCGQKQKELFLNSRFSRIVFHPQNHSTLFAAIRSNDTSNSASGIYKSTDEGITWSRLDKNLPDIRGYGATDIVIDPKNPKIAYVSFHKDHIYKTIDLDSDQPTWVKQQMPSFNASRISLSMSKLFPNIIYVIASDKNSDLINQFYRTLNADSINEETRWEKIDIPVSKDSSPWEDGTIGGEGSYNLDIKVDPKNPDIIYLAGISIWKVIYNKTSNTWIFRDIGKSIHSDNHVIEFDPNNNFILYVGNDGGIYRSRDTGETWDDTINEGLCITQCAFMGEHPRSDSVFFVGTQDNGTLQFRNSSLFVYSDSGDGGFVSIDPDEPNNIIHQYIEGNLFHSKQAGKKDSWISINVPRYPSYFYSPFALDQLNPKNIAFGAADRIYFDKNQGLDGWKKSDKDDDFVTLDGMILGVDWITSLNYVNSNLIYVGTNRGKVFRLTKTVDGWNKPEAIHQSPPLPEGWIWDVAPYPDDDKTFLVVMAGLTFDFVKGPHVWRGTIDKSGKVIWKNVSPKNDKDEIIDIPVYSVVIDRKEPNTIYIGTDAGVFRTTDNCKTWECFNEGLPNSAVFDMRILYEPKKILRAVTHGRGTWEISLDELHPRELDIFVRDHLMDTGRYTPSVETRAAFEDPLQHEDISKSIKLGSKLPWYKSPDIKVDSPIGNDSMFQFEVDDVDYVKFESKLYHRNIKRARINHIYVQIHNRGFRCVDLGTKDKIKIKLLYSDVVSKDIDKRQYRDLPPDFWSKFPDDPLDTSYWKSIGEVKFLPDLPKTMSNTEPTVVEWDWNAPPDIGSMIWLLVIIDSAKDPISQSSKECYSLQELVRSEKRIAVRVVNVDQV
ncbi:MAG TPA: hypothetical protein VJ767_05810 [Nitrososphaeraceae archaeon]|nr:hypothetical protein [Nitrososphaeraceae archaeon]